jgi:ubiquinone/menaquinone biosynthesis C-methylase UbiE
MTNHTSTATAAAQAQTGYGEYVLATGSAAVRRLFALHDIYGPAGRRVLIRAGLRPGMRIADFGCGVGAMTTMLSRMVGPSGGIIGVDANAAQIEQASRICRDAGCANASFVVADACDTGLPRESFDLVYCRYLLLHLTDPAACLREMRAVLKPGGILVVEDGDLATATSVPRTAFDAFADLFAGIATMRGVDYSLARNLFHMVKDAGFADPRIEIHQPAATGEEVGQLLKWSIEEAGPGFISAGLITPAELDCKLAEMQAAIESREVLILAPRVSLVWATKE